MFQLKDLLGKFKEVEDPKEIRLMMCSVLNNELGADLVKENDIDFKNNIVWIRSNPAVKHKILTSKARYLDLLSKLLPNQTITDLR